MTVAKADRPGRHQHPGYTVDVRELVAVAITPLTEQITHFEFADPDGAVLTPYRPGSHLLVTAGSKRNAYSLVDDGINPYRYGISVMRCGEGGGSDWLHDNLELGAKITVEGPRSMFAPVLNQRHALLIAGGIGVTPILSHARALARCKGSAEVIYAHRAGHGAHLDDLRALAQQQSLRLYEATTAGEAIELLRQRLSDQPLGTHAYACGPPALLETYKQLTAQAGWPPARVHLERFSAPPQDPGAPFTAKVASTGEVLAVPAGVSLLARLLDAGYTVPNLCRQGVCGECRIPVRAARLEHRDYVLSDEERSGGDSMLCCVSRGSEIEVLI